jgi:hypothetical protein
MHFFSEKSARLGCNEALKPIYPPSYIQSFGAIAESLFGAIAESQP